MATDVAERTETQAATEALPASETEARESTDTSTAVQTEAGSERESTEESSPPSGRAARLAALAEAEREAAIEEGRQAALEEIRRTGSKQQQEARKTQLKEAFPKTIQSVEALLNRAIDEGRALTTQEALDVKNHFQRYNLVAETAAAETLADDIRDQIYGMLPKAAQEEFTRATTGTDDKPVDLGTYFAAAVEHAAPHSKWAKSLDLESALKSSAKLRKEIEADRVEQYDKGYEEGLSAPPGTSPDGGRAAGRTARGEKTYLQLEEGYGNGTLSKDEEKIYLSMRAERARQR